MLAFCAGIEKTVGMRGAPDPQLAMLTTLSTEELIPAGHPIRRIRAVVEAVLGELDAELGAMYAGSGRPSVPPERLLKATVLMALYSIRSERAFCERLNYDLLFKWFLDLPIDAKAFDATTFTKNRDRLLDHEIADRFFAAVVAQAKLRRYRSSEHFSVDGTLLEAWASHKSFKPKDGPPGPPSAGRNAEVSFHGERRSNATHQSTTDPEARLAKKGKGKEAHLAYAAHALMEHRNGLLMDFQVNQATGTAEREIVPDLIDQARERGFRPRTLAGDKGYDTRQCVADLRAHNVTPHLAQNTRGRRSAIDQRTTRHAGYAVSQRKRKRVEEIFGWMKTVGGFRRTRFIGLELTQLAAYLVATAYNLVRMARLVAGPMAA